MVEGGGGFQYNIIMNINGSEQILSIYLKSLEFILY